MEITRELVLKLYERKDPKRKQMLFELCRDLFTSTMSAKFLVDMINEKLSMQAVSLYDVKYIRAKMKKWGDQQMPVQKSEKPEVQAQPKAATNFHRSEPEPYVKPSKKY
jgi:signal transduction protein with GAF and PtsI domain